MMRYELTEHARRAIEERQITLDWVDLALENPDLVVPDEAEELKHYLKKIPMRDNRVLRVIINIDTLRVVTAFFDRSMRNKL